MADWPYNFASLPFCFYISLFHGGKKCKKKKDGEWLKDLLVISSGSGGVVLRYSGSVKL